MYKAMEAADDKLGAASSHEACIASETEAGLEQERFFQVDWWKLVRHVLWRSEPMGPQGAPELEPLAKWAEGTEPGQWPLPAGSPRTVEEAGVAELCWAFVAFLWRRSRPVGPVILMVLMGFSPICISVLMGKIVGVIENPGENGEARQQDKMQLALYLLAFWAVVELSIRLFYKFEVDVPEASMRHHFRHVLMRSLLRLRGGAADRFPPGESAAVLVSCVQDVVDLVWAAFFSGVRVLSAFVTSAVIAQVHVRKGRPSVVATVFFVFVAMPLCALVLARLHLAPRTDLATRKRKWNRNMFGLAVAQVARFRSMPTPASEAELGRAVQTFGDTAFVYRKRGFHSFFMDLVTKDTILEFCVLCYVGLCVLVGSEVIDGRLTVEEFVVLSSAVTSLKDGLQKSASLAVGLPHGHAALVTIADIINSDAEAQGMIEHSSGESGDSSE